jgi:hypothetical protein
LRATQRAQGGWVGEAGREAASPLPLREEVPTHETLGKMA